MGRLDDSRSTSWDPEPGWGALRRQRRRAGEGDWARVQRKGGLARFDPGGCVRSGCDGAQPPRAGGGSWRGSVKHESRLGTMTRGWGALRRQRRRAGEGDWARVQRKGGLARFDPGGCVRSGCDGAQPPRAGGGSWRGSVKHESRLGTMTRGWGGAAPSAPKGRGRGLGSGATERRLGSLRPGRVHAERLRRSAAPQGRRRFMERFRETRITTWDDDPWLGGAAPSAPKGRGRGLGSGATERRLGSLRPGRVRAERLRRSAAPQGRRRFMERCRARPGRPWRGRRRGWRGRNRKALRACSSGGSGAGGDRGLRASPGVARGR
jgi:hypothetical protein